MKKPTTKNFEKVSVSVALKFDATDEITRPAKKVALSGNISESVSSGAMDQIELVRAQILATKNKTNCFGGSLGKTLCLDT